MEPWKTIERKVICQPNKFLTVELHKIQLPNGRIIEDWGWLVLPDFANVIAQTKEKKFLIFNQTKYAASGVTLAPPGGFLEAGEDPLEGAKRELLEETGYIAEHWFYLGNYAIDANRGAGRGYFFLALNASKIQAPIQDDLEEQELLLLTRRELEEALDSNRFAILPWAAAVSFALRKLNNLNRNNE
ncbi:MAG: NUDIX hydrolase [Verrucomicrobiia bacterium]